jgi:hypothetical protein
LANAPLDDAVTALVDVAAKSRENQARNLFAGVARPSPSI